MADQPISSEPYGFQYSEAGSDSRKQLPPEVRMVLQDVLDMLAANLDAFPGRMRSLTRDGNIRLYSHPSPALQVTFQVEADRRVLRVLHVVAPRVQITKPIFISYSHKDAAWLEKLRLFLRPLEDQELISVWDDTEIRTGSDWLAEIRKALESARVAVFLVTQNFLTSRFIRDEELPTLLQAAQDRGCLIFVIAVSSATFEDSPLAKFQGANPPDKPLDLLPEPEQNKVFTDIFRKMKAAVTVE